MSPGDPIASVDPADLPPAPDAARARIATQRAAVGRLASAEAAVTKAGLGQNPARSRLERAGTDLPRTEGLASCGAGTVARRDSARTARGAGAVTPSEARRSVDAATARVARERAERDPTFATVADRLGDGLSGHRLLLVGVPFAGGVAAWSPVDLGEPEPSRFEWWRLLGPRPFSARWRAVPEERSGSGTQTGHDRLGAGNTKGAHPCPPPSSPISPTTPARR